MQHHDLFQTFNVLRVIKAVLDEKRELVALLVPVKKRMADPATLKSLRNTLSVAITMLNVRTISEIAVQFSTGAPGQHERFEYRISAPLRNAAVITFEIEDEHDQ